MRASPGPGRGTASSSSSFAATAARRWAGRMRPVAQTPPAGGVLSQYGERQAVGMTGQ
jgi:hypothetical protein